MFHRGSPWRRDVRTIVAPIWGGRYSFHCLPHLQLDCIPAFQFSFFPPCSQSVWMGEDKPTTYSRAPKQPCLQGLPVQISNFGWHQQAMQPNVDLLHGQVRST